MIAYVVSLFQGEFVSCLLALLRHMKDRHYQQLLQRFTSKDDLRVSQLSTLSYWHQFIIHTKRRETSSLSLSGLSPAYLHCVSDPDKTRDVPQRLDGHAARHQQVRFFFPLQILHGGF